MTYQKRNFGDGGEQLPKAPPQDHRVTLSRTDAVATMLAFEPVRGVPPETIADWMNERRR